MQEEMPTQPPSGPPPSQSWPTQHWPSASLRPNVVKWVYPSGNEKDIEKLESLGYANSLDLEAAYQKFKRRRPNGVYECGSCLA